MVVEGEDDYPVSGRVLCIDSDSVKTAGHLEGEVAPVDGCLNRAVPTVGLLVNPVELLHERIGGTEGARNEGQGLCCEAHLVC